MVLPVLDESAEVVYQKLHRRMNLDVDTAEVGDGVVRGPRDRRELDVDTESGKTEERDKNVLNLARISPGARREGDSLG